MQWNIARGEYEKYDCTVTVNDIAHAVATKGYVWDANTNDLKKDGSEYVRLTSGVGTVRNLDNKQSAIIAGATYMGATSGIEGNSLDNQAAAYFKDVKVDILKEIPFYIISICPVLPIWIMIRSRKQPRLRFQRLYPVIWYSVL